jgi:hypothetical protein
MLACKELHDQINKAKTSEDENSYDSKFDSERAERLIFRISQLKKMNTAIIEELFFNDAIGNVQIDSIIPSIIGSDSNNNID